MRTDLSGLGPLRVWLVRIKNGGRHLTLLGLGADDLLCRRGQQVERVAAAGGPLGLGPAQQPPHTVELDLADEDTVVLVSTGVLDALDVQRHRYGLAGLEQALQALDHGTARDLIARVCSDLSRYTSGPRR